jgi:hypothetical protein
MISSWFELVGPWGSPTKMQRHHEERLTAVEPEKMATELFYPRLCGWKGEFTVDKT